MKHAIQGFMDGYLQKSAVVNEAFTRGKVRRLEAESQTVPMKKGTQADMDQKTQQQQQIAQNPSVPSTYGEV